MKIPLPFCVAGLTAALIAPLAAQTPTSQPSSAPQASPAAQATPPPLPPGPLIQKSAPAFSEWSVVCKYASGGSGAASASGSPAPATGGVSGEAGAGGAHKDTPNAMNRVTVVTKTGNVRREVTNAANGEKTTLYFSGDMMVIQDLASKTPPLLRITNSSVSNRRDFSGFKWINEKNFVGIQKAQNREYMIFRGKTSLAEQALWEDVDPGSQPEAPAVAVIDVETRLPVSVQIGDETRVFRFNPPPTERLAFPADVQAVIDARQSRVQAAQVSLPPP